MHGEANARKLLAFVVIYDPAHPNHSRLDYALGYFMEYQITKRLVDQYFIPIIGPSSDPSFGALVPEDNPLESCLWVVLDQDGAIFRREDVYANPDEGHEARASSDCGSKLVTAPPEVRDKPGAKTMRLGRDWWHGG